MKEKACLCECCRNVFGSDCQCEKAKAPEGALHPATEVEGGVIGPGHPDSATTDIAFYEKQAKISVSLSVAVAWLHPPKDTAEAIEREQTEIKVQSAADSLRDKVKELLVDKLNPIGPGHPDYPDTLLMCYLSGQMSEQQWQEHLAADFPFQPPPDNRA